MPPGPHRRCLTTEPTRGDLRPERLGGFLWPVGLEATRAGWAVPDPQGGLSASEASAVAETQAGGWVHAGHSARQAHHVRPPVAVMYNVGPECSTITEAILRAKRTADQEHSRLRMAPGLTSMPHLAASGPTAQTGQTTLAASVAARSCDGTETRRNTGLVPCAPSCALLTPSSTSTSTSNIVHHIALNSHVGLSVTCSLRTGRRPACVHSPWIRNVRHLHTVCAVEWGGSCVFR